MGIGGAVRGRDNVRDGGGGDGLEEGGDGEGDGRKGRNGVEWATGQNAEPKILNY